MTIPLDFLYDYIKGCCIDDSLIYRADKHGSQNLLDYVVHNNYNQEDYWFLKRIICYDQEPLYQSVVDQMVQMRLNQGTPYDRVLLLHSCHGIDLDWNVHNCMTIFYWAHGVIARDWYRYAEFDPVVSQPKNIEKKFLIYNRSWSGSREYRLKFTELIVEQDLVDDCRTWFNPQDYQHFYTQHTFTNQEFLINRHDLHDIIPCSTEDSTASARYCVQDYKSCEWEIVLETVFDFPAVFLTEKILRPIALGMPFVCVGPPNSLEFLRSYGFQTYSDIIDESYDTCDAPSARLSKIVNCMHSIKNLSQQETDWAVSIAQVNRKKFFHSNFLAAVTDELKRNLLDALGQVKPKSKLFERAFVEYQKFIKSR